MSRQVSRGSTSLLPKVRRVQMKSEDPVERAAKSTDHADFDPELEQSS
jgi:hypothetical protein